VEKPMPPRLIINAGPTSWSPPACAAAPGGAVCAMANRVTLSLQGKRVQAVPQVLDSDENVTAALQTFLEADPKLAQYFNVGLDENKKPRLEDVAKESSNRVLIYFAL
jgi:hypothetical protein